MLRTVTSSLHLLNNILRTPPTRLLSTCLITKMPNNPLNRMLDYNAKWAAQPDTQDQVRSTALTQQPKVLWLGCADSRIPESLLCGTKPGEVFVHRNIANCFQPGDASATAVLAFAVENLGVEHVVVVGHYGCGGVKAAMASAKERHAAKWSSEVESANDYLKAPEQDEGAATLTRWLAPLRSLAVAQLRAQSDSGVNAPADVDADELEHRRLVRTHCAAQVSNIESTSIVQKAARSGKPITVEGWVYDVATGRLEDGKI